MSLFLTKTTFKIRCKTKPGEEVCLIGDCREMGDWDADNSHIIMKESYSSQNPQIWEGTLTLPTELKVHYKYFVKYKGQIRRWENFSGNRIVQPHGREMVVDDGNFGELAGVGQSSNVMVDEGWLTKHVQLRVFLGEPTSTGLSHVKLFDDSKRYKIQVKPLDILTLTTSPQGSKHNPQMDPNDTTDQLSRPPCCSPQSALHKMFEHLLMSGHSEDDDSHSFVLKSDSTFVMNADSLEHLSFNVDIYEQEQTNNILIGRVHVHYTELSHQLRGAFTRTILNQNLDPIGYLNLDYLIITPFLHPCNNLSSLWDRHTKDFYIGHRGAGSNDAILKQPLTENTLLAFFAAARLGAHYIEFDVQLTKDNVPIICHDEEIWINTTASDKSIIKLKVPVNKLKLSKIKKLKPIIISKEEQRLMQQEEEEEDGQLKHDKDTGQNRLKPEQGLDLSQPPHEIRFQNQKQQLETQPHAKSSDNPSVRIQTHSVNSDVPTSQAMKELFRQQKGVRRSASQNSIYDLYKEYDSLSSDEASSSPEPIPKKVKKRVVAPTHENIWGLMDTYPSLEEALQFIPKSVGFNVEIKYPDTDELAQVLSISERNFYVDTILKVIFDFAQDREIIISSFDPDICRMCALKQIKFPVFFLTEAGALLFDDPRKNSVEEAIHFARSARLCGIVSESTPIIENPGLIRKAHDVGLLVFTWGHANNNPESVRIQKKNGVDAVIADNILHVTRQARQQSQTPTRNPYIGNFIGKLKRALHQGTNSSALPT